MSCVRYMTCFKVQLAAASRTLKFFNDSSNVAID